jgi:prevent-host-death family protein
MAITVGARELKNRLGKYLRMVREGSVVIVSDRGRPVAELRRIGLTLDRLQERLQFLASQRLIEVGDFAPLAPIQRVKLRGAALSDTIEEGRADRL